MYFVLQRRYLAARTQDECWRRGRLTEVGDVESAGWADPTNQFRGGSHPAINHSNADAIDSFHQGGAYFLLADGSTQFISESLNAKILVSLISRQGGEIAAEL
ncbi:DUF1559 domain-containing protein [Planctomycetes bacterium K23_9]|uniref:DUF1559 domain-containing protein n=1 Tax=Stieleria marina TaxID=1930275 RepID=A0A517P1F7_9BACT|nr:hypothetical protein K239x_52270 [Planctomycetes bacterium K23_9]